MLRPDDCVLELGGGIGFLSTFVALRLGPTGRVITYEANPDLLDVIRRTHALNGTRVDARNGVLTADREPGTATFYKRIDFDAGSLSSTGAGITGEVAVPALPLADVVARERPNVLVFDIEGAEYDLFRGARLDGVRAAVGEFHPRQLSLAQINEVMGNFRDQGLFYDLTSSRGQVMVFQRAN